MPPLWKRRYRFVWLRHVASSVLHQQYHDTDIVTVRGGRSETSSRRGGGEQGRVGFDRAAQVTNMAIREIIRMGHPVLRQKARPVREDEIKSPHLCRLVDDMIETLDDAGGIGLALHK